MLLFKQFRDQYIFTDGREVEKKVANPYDKRERTGNPGYVPWGTVNLVIMNRAFKVMFFTAFQE